MSDKEFIEQFGELLQRYEMYRLGKRKTFKDFSSWVRSLHD